MRGIADWLASIGLEEYVQRFADNGIDLAVVQHLTEQDLEVLGLPLGHRRKLLRAIAALGQPGAAKSGTAAEPLPRDDAERRQLTVLFCDLVGSTALSAGRDPEDFRKLIQAYNTCVTDIIGNHDGSIARYMGDGVLACFGYPQASEDDAEQAARAGLALVAGVANLGTEIGAALQVRVGIATGLVVVMTGHGADQQTVVGETPKLAAQLQALAEPGTVLIEANSHRLMGGHFNYRDLGVRAVEGRAEPLTVWQVLGTSGAPSRFAARHKTKLPPLFGREEEIALLLRRWRHTTKEQGQVVLLSGDPGIGKSHIALALDELLQAEPHVTLRNFCSAHHTNSALFPVVGQLGRAAEFEPSDSPEQKRSKLETLLAQSSAEPEHVAVLANILGLPGSDCAQIQKLSPQQRKEKTTAALLAQLRGLAARQPVLVIFEDLHWIDPTSLELLAAAVEEVPKLRVLMLFTARPEFTPPWRNHPYVTTLPLSPLGRREGTALVEHVTGGTTLPKDVTDEILARADGVPLFIEELTKTVLEAAAPREGQEHQDLAGARLDMVPRTLHGSLLARLDRLGPGREVAQIGAVIGREFSYELLRSVATMPDFMLSAALDRLVRSELVYLRTTPGHTYVFKHALVRDAAEEMLLRARRKELHGTIARALEEGFPEVVEAQPELIAHHYREADDAAKSVPYLSVAGNRALSRSALKEAHEHITQALQLISGLADDDQRRRDELNLQIALARTLLEQKGYADQQVGDAYTKARDSSLRVGDAGMHFAVLYGLWAHHYVGGKPAAMLEQANEFLAFANRQNEIGPSIVGYRLVGTSRLINGQIADAAAALQQALALYDPDAHGPASPSGQTLRARFGQDLAVAIHSYGSWALWLSGRVADAKQAAEACLARSRVLAHDDQSRFYALWHAGMAYVLLRNVNKVADIGEKLIELANDRGLPYWQALGNFLCGWRATRTGRPRDAIRMLQEGLRLWAQTGARIFRPICMAFLAEAYAAIDEMDLARQTFEEALRIASETGERWAEPEIHRLLGDLFAHCGQPDAAIDRYERAIAVACEQGSRSLELRATTSLARILSGQGRHPDARERLLTVYRAFDVKGDTADLTEAKTLLEAGTAA
jgi:class 3 adenylate cyclase/predicted ATPase/energy-coupling factor transporter ATP-binding protein EcfA2